MSFVRHLVSQNKIRYIDDEFDIDLTYITQNIIAMGFPAKGFEATYRNPLDEVAEFLEQNHAGHYKIFNLSEKPYDQTSFKGPIEHFPFPDHHPPPLQILLTIVKHAIEWLSADPDNVVVVHCMAGMGRTGTIISSILLFKGEEKTAKDALEHFANIRTMTGEGVTKPCQRRYVKYAELLLEEARKNNTDIYTLPQAPTKYLKRITIHNLFKSPRMSFMTIQNSEWDIIYNSSWLADTPDNSNISPKYEINQSFTGDYTINIYEVKKKVLQSSAKKHIIYFSFSTLFLQGDQILVKKSLLDIIGGDKDDEKFPADMTLEMEFDTQNPEVSVEVLLT